MVNVEFIYDVDCPNAEQARAQLSQALAEVGLPPQWQEWNSADSKSPDYAHLYGSPTILVDGKDVAGASPAGTAKCCRVYSDQKGNIRGLPSMEAITSALLKAKAKKSVSARADCNRSSKWRRSLGVFPVIGAVLLPGISCPACWPAYAAFPSSMGLGFINYTPYLFPLILLCLVVALFSLGFRARKRRGFGPLVLGLVAAIVIVTSKFIFAWKAATYAGAILLVAASVWNLRPRKTAGASCPDCVPAAAPQTELEHKQSPKEVSYERQT